MYFTLDVEPDLNTLGIGTPVEYRFPLEVECRVFLAVFQRSGRLLRIIGRAAIDRVFSSQATGKRGRLREFRLLPPACIVIVADSLSTLVGVKRTGMLEISLGVV